MTPWGSGPEELLRQLAPRVLGVLVRRYGDFALAEDAVQEAILAALLQWPAEGVPNNAYGWLATVASRRFAGLARSEAARRHRENLAAATQPSVPAEVSDVDDSLTLLFLCCHPSLPAASAIPLTLRAVGGLTTAEIARAFLVPEPTMGKRISRAKQRVKEAGAAFRMPTEDEWQQRLAAVMHISYLIFNEGYAASSGEHVARQELSGEAIRLTRMLHARLAEQPEVAGLLALMLLTDARRPARTGAHGELISLAEQDRSLWDQSLIAEGTELISVTLPRRQAGYYQIQAAIAALHDEAKTTADTDWPQILALYGVLARISANPMVALNRAIAAAMVHGPHTGLAMLTRLEKTLAGNHRLDATRAHLLEMAGDREGAARHYRLAAGRTTSEAERRYLLSKAST